MVLYTLILDGVPLSPSPVTIAAPIMAAAIATGRHISVLAKFGR